jgi:hypothetical protein
MWDRKMASLIFLSHIFLSVGRNDDQGRIELRRSIGKKYSFLAASIRIIRSGADMN